MKISKTFNKSNTMLAIGLTLFISCSSLAYFYAFYMFDPSPKYFYDADEVTRLCAIFQLDENIDFCSNPANQGPNTFVNTLETFYPPVKTTYDDIIDFVKRLPSEAATCFYNGSQRYPGFCPPPPDCTGSGGWYGCSFFLGGKVSWLRINFHISTGTVTSYLVARPPGTS